MSHHDHHDLIALPADPMPAVGRLIKHFRRTEILELDELGHCGLHLMGVALYHVHEDGGVVMSRAEASVPASDEERAALLERHFPAGGATDSYSAGANAVPWTLFLRMALELIQQWLDSRS